MDLRKHKKGTAKFSAGTPLPVLEDGAPPTEFRIFREGINETDRGPQLFDAIAAALVMESRKERGNPLYFDLNHGMLRDDPSPEEGKSYGEFDIEVRGGELWAVNCRWTEEGAELIAKRAYNLFSPAFQWFDDEAGQRRPYELINVALVNLAGLNGIRPLAASALFTDQDEGDHLMDEKDIKAQLDAAKATIATQKNEIETLRAKDATRGIAALSAVLGVNLTSIEDAVAAANGIVRDRAEVLKLSGQESVAGAIGVFRSWQASHGRVEMLSAEIESGKAKDRTARFTALLDKAVTDKLITPAWRKDFWEKTHVVDGAATEAGLTMLSAFVGSSPTPVVATSEHGTAQPSGLTTAVGAELSRTMKIDEAAFQKFEAERAAIRAQGARR